MKILLGYSLAALIYLFGMWVTWGYSYHRAILCQKQFVTNWEKDVGRKPYFTSIYCDDISRFFISAGWPIYWFFRSSDIVWSDKP